MLIVIFNFIDNGFSLTVQIIPMVWYIVLLHCRNVVHAEIPSKDVFGEMDKKSVLKWKDIYTMFLCMLLPYTSLLVQDSMFMVC